jgi:hypothetical protein
LFPDSRSTFLTVGFSDSTGEDIFEVIECRGNRQ